MKFSVYTSIAPVHILGDEQQRCARSWMDAGYAYTTVNGPQDHITVPDGGRRVDVQPSTIYRKPYIFLDDIFAQALKDRVDVAIITNSDIELLGDITDHIAQAKDGMVIGRRINHPGIVGKGKPEQYGIDVFIVPRSILMKIPRSLFVLGQTWWDYWLPFWAIRSGLKVSMVKPGKYGHREHKTQWSYEEWERMTALFQGYTGEFVLRKPHDTGQAVHKLISKAA
jgi:hypothetical protein